MGTKRLSTRQLLQIAAYGVIVGWGVHPASHIISVVLIALRRGLHVSFLEVMLSLVFWGSLLGGAGAILGVPLTLALRNFLSRPADTQVAAAGGTG